MGISEEIRTMEGHERESDRGKTGDREAQRHSCIFTACLHVVNLLSCSSYFDQAIWFSNIDFTLSDAQAKFQGKVQPKFSTKMADGYEKMWNWKLDRDSNREM